MVCGWDIKITVYGLQPNSYTFFIWARVLEENNEIKSESLFIG